MTVVSGCREVYLVTVATNRSYTPLTSRLLSEYLAAHYPGARIFQEYHLTLPNEAAIARAGGRVSPRYGGTIIGYPDAAVFLPGEVQLWEAKAALSFAAIGQIEGYGASWHASVEARFAPGLPVTLHILAATDNPGVRAVAEAKGIQVVIYNPPWFATAVNRRTAEHLTVGGTQPPPAESETP